MSVTDTDPRAEYIAGLRALADAIETNPAMPLPDTGRGLQLTWVVSWDADPKASARSIIRGVGGKWDKDAGGRNDELFLFRSRGTGLALEIIAKRDQVCRRVVTGTREVTKTVPAPDAPMVEVTETVEDVEWQCEPLLAEATA